MTAVEKLNNLLEENECLGRLSVEGFYRPLYIIADVEQNYRGDIAGYVEHTLHTMLDNDFNENEISEVLGAFKPTPEEADLINDDDEYYYIDLDYIIPGQLLDVQIPAEL